MTTARPFFVFAKRRPAIPIRNLRLAPADGLPLTTRSARRQPAIIYPNTFKPCIPTRAMAVLNRPEWLHEIKHDGYRLIVQRDGRRVRLITATATTGAIAIR